MTSSNLRRGNITALAPENLARIIWHASRKTPRGIVLDVRRLTNLRLVCKTWGRLIEATPFLWNSFSPNQSLRTMQKILDHCGPSIPLSISQKDSPYAEESMSPNAIELVFSQLHRTTALHIVLKKSKWETASPAFEANDSASNLESLEIVVAHPKIHSFEWAQDPLPPRHELGLKKLPLCPKLQNLRLSGLRAPLHFDPLPSLVSLHLSNQGRARSVKDLLELLRCLPNLQRLRLIHCFPKERREDDDDEDEDDEDDEDPALGLDNQSQTTKPSAPVVMKSLRFVQIIDKNIGGCAFFLASIRATLARLHLTYVEPRAFQSERLERMVKDSTKLLDKTIIPSHKLFVIQDIFDTDGHGEASGLRVSFSLRNDTKTRTTSSRSSQHQVDDEADDDDEAPLKVSLRKYFEHDFPPDNDVGSFCRSFISSMDPFVQSVSKLLIDHSASHYHWYWDWIGYVLRRHLPAVRCVELIPCSYISDAEDKVDSEEESEGEDEGEEDEDKEPRSRLKDFEDFDPDNDGDAVEKPSRTFGRLVRQLGSGWVIESPRLLKKT